ncbi:MAG: choice-of-anchor D domain-containing protein [Acidobacteria bacterium]|nr:choice-of-anchor D domain-containing protein [Acidobacteriota bacterium]
MVVSICAMLAGSSRFARAQTSSGLEVSPAAIDFGEDAVHSDSPPQTITLRNPTKSPISLEKILASGIDFSEKNDCPPTLAPGAQCRVQVSFTPVISGPRAGNLAIAESSGNPHFVALNGTGK